jgi:hypothetical protein
VLRGLTVLLVGGLPRGLPLFGLEPLDPLALLLPPFFAETSFEEAVGGGDRRIELYASAAAVPAPAALGAAHMAAIRDNNTRTRQHQTMLEASRNA